MSTVTYMAEPASGSGPVGERIAQARGFRRLTQKQLIDRMDSLASGQAPSRRTLGKWEHGETCPDVDDLVLLARATQFSVDWFVHNLDGISTPTDPSDPSVQAGMSFPCTTDELAARRSFRDLRFEQAVA